MSWFRTWLDSVAPPGRPVILVGFSGGAAFAGGLVLSEPERFDGAAILYGTLPFAAGVPVTPSRLVGLPVFVAQCDNDTVIPRELLDATWAYLLGDSGAPAYARRDPGGHGITAQTLAELGGWVAERISYLGRDGRSTLETPADVVWPLLPGGTLAPRAGHRPLVSWSIPQQQESDNAPAGLQEQLFNLIADLRGVTTGQSAISVPGARGLLVQPREHPDLDAFLVPAAGEFAHLHPAHDGSLDLALPPAQAADAIAKGWAIAHPLAGIRLTPGMVMVYGPRDAEEVSTVYGLVCASHRYATVGESQ